jgi:hypothetical protein
VTETPAEHNISHLRVRNPTRWPLRRVFELRRCHPSPSLLDAASTAGSATVTTTDLSTSRGRVGSGDCRLNQSSARTMNYILQDSVTRLVVVSAYSKDELVFSYD